MTYFELYQQPFSLQINSADIKKKYYELCKQFHPDKFSLTDNDAQESAMQMSVQINEGLRILSNFNLRLKYILQLKAELDSTENDYKLSNYFLMEMMDLNEEIMDAKVIGNDASLAVITQKLNDLEHGMQQSIDWSLAIPDLSVIEHPQMMQLKQHYFESKYIYRLQNLLHGKDVEM